jgi:hypothetical protein
MYYVLDNIMGLSGEDFMGIIGFVILVLPIPLAIIILLVFGLKNKIGILASILTGKVWLFNEIGPRITDNVPLIQLALLALIILLFHKLLINKDFFAWLLVGWDILISISWSLVPHAFSPLIAICEILIIGNSLIPLYIAIIHSMKPLRPLFYPEIIQS